MSRNKNRNEYIPPTITTQPVHAAVDPIEITANVGEEPELVEQDFITAVDDLPIHEKKPTKADMYVGGFRMSRAYVCGQELGGAGGCRQNVELWHSPNGTPVVVDSMPGDNSLWVVHKLTCPARKG